MVLGRNALSALLVLSWSTIAIAAPTIDTAQGSGVAGYPIGIFGSQFGNTPGKVTIRGEPARVTRWSEGVIEAVVPAVGAGTGDLEVTAPSGTAKRPFVVYTIDPNFLVAPTELENLAFGKKVVIHGSYTDYGRNGNIHAPEFLGANDNGGAADLTPPITVAIDLGQAVSGKGWFNFHGSGNWYEKQPGNPKAYTIEASSDSTDGQNGHWDALATITDNERDSRSHEVSMSGQRWIRWRITATEGGSNCRMREVRFFRPKPGRGGTGIDAIGIFGDSNTANDFERTGKTSLAWVLRSLKADGSQPLTYIMGMSGQNASVLRLDAASSARSIAAALKLQTELRYVGIALGTNDAHYDPMTGQYKENLEQGVRQILDAGRVPIVARLVDTRPEGHGSPANKRKILENIDEIAARYRLIPGPDYYTAFRQHLDVYISDGTHHTDEGGVVANRMWAEAMMRAGVYAQARSPEARPKSIAEGQGASAEGADPSEPPPASSPRQDEGDGGASTTNPSDRGAPPTHGEFAAAGSGCRNPGCSRGGVLLALLVVLGAGVFRQNSARPR